MELSISAVQTRTGLSARTIRYWEELGLLPGIRRRAGGRRVYGEDELERLAFIQRLKSMGLSLQEIKELNAVYAIAGSTHDMLRRLDVLLEKHEEDVATRLLELESLQGEIGRYRERVAQRIRGGSPRTRKERA
jgi:DNA-binding transcriptional MerR regulator